MTRSSSRTPRHRLDRGIYIGMITIDERILDCLVHGSPDIHRAWIFERNGLFVGFWLSRTMDVISVGQWLLNKALCIVKM
jgi:hypothetical protein